MAAQPSKRAKGTKGKAATREVGPTRGSPGTIGLVLPLLVPWTLAAAWGKHAIQWLSAHTGLPTILVSAALLVVGYRVLKRTSRLVLEVLVVTAALFAAAQVAHVSHAGHAGHAGHVGHVDWIPDWIAW